LRPDRIIRAGLAFLASFALGAALLPGPLQALAPRWNGLAEIVAGVFLDDPARAETARADLAEARARVAGFFGEPVPHARVILCATDACADRFMGYPRPAGRAYGAHLVVLAPEGLTPTVMTHEFAHVALHARMSFADLVSPRFPVWFDEGLASWISGDDRLIPPDAAARARVLEARHFSDWSGVMDDLGWQAGYGAAMALVDDMSAAGGAEALRAFIGRVAEGADFDDERERLLAFTRSGEPISRGQP